MANILMEGLTSTVIGMGMVFGVLGLLCVILSFFKYLTPQETKTPKNERQVVEVSTDEAVICDEAQNLADDYEVAAVISAAIAAYLDGESRIVSIRKAPAPRAAYKGWTAAAIRENHRGLY